MRSSTDFAPSPISKPSIRSLRAQASTFTVQYSIATITTTSFRLIRPSSHIDISGQTRNMEFSKVLHVAKSRRYLRPPGFEIRNAAKVRYVRLSEIDWFRFTWWTPWPICLWGWWKVKKGSNWMHLYKLREFSDAWLWDVETTYSGFSSLEWAGWRCWMLVSIWLRFSLRYNINSAEME